LKCILKTGWERAIKFKSRVAVTTLLWRWFVICRLGLAMVNLLYTEFKGSGFISAIGKGDAKFTKWNGLEEL